MRTRNFIFIFIAVGLLPFAAQAQTRPPEKGRTTAVDQTAPIRRSPAYAEVLLRETELEAELEGLLGSYTEEYPKVKELRFAIAEIEKSKAMLLAVKPDEAGTLTLALGKLLVRRVDALADLSRLKQTLADSHPDVKRAQRMVDVYDKAISEVLELPK